MSDIKNELNNALEHLQTELGKLRTGRANPAMIEDIKVDYYGSTMEIKGLANISVPESRQLLVQPWDKNALQPIEKAIRSSDLGINPVNEGDKIRIVVPDLTEERRKELSKVAGKVAEETKVRVRNIREQEVKKIKKREESGDITEDDKKRQTEEIQKQVDECNKKIEETLEAKQAEIMKI